jgi:hypothetical protein
MAREPEPVPATIVTPSATNLLNDTRYIDPAKLANHIEQAYLVSTEAPSGEFVLYLIFISRLILFTGIRQLLASMFATRLAVYQTAAVQDQALANLERLYGLIGRDFEDMKRSCPDPITFLRSLVPIHQGRSIDVKDWNYLCLLMGWSTQWSFANEADFLAFVQCNTQPCDAPAIRPSMFDMWLTSAPPDVFPGAPFLAGPTGITDHASFGESSNGAVPDGNESTQ